MEIFNQKKELRYTQDFKEYIKDSEGVLVRAKKIIDGLCDSEVEVGTCVKGEQLSVTYLGRNEIRHPFKYFRVEDSQEKKDFFVKVDFAKTEKSGIPEFVAMEQLKADLADLPKVRAVEYQLGYQDSKKSYYVSKYEEALQNRLRDELEDIGKERGEDDEEIWRLIERADVIEDHLKKKRSYEDIGTHNMAYDRASDTIILFDTYLKK